MLATYYSWFKAFHIISVICWMSAIFYLPRLYAYHTRAFSGSELDKTFQIMERRLCSIIMNPAMIATYISGLTLAYIYGFSALGTWFYIKIAVVICITVIHGFFVHCRKAFIFGENIYSEKFYKIANEVPVILMIIAVCVVVIKPFE